MIYCRINLSKTNYTELTNYSLLNNPNKQHLRSIYRQYCRYKQFSSVLPLFDNDFDGKYMDVLGYKDLNENVVAFSLIRKHDKHNVEAVQFAWNYQEPKLRLGIHSLENECARYKRLGYRYLYLGHVDDYKRRFDGFEIVGLE
jgi:hypothetical protein